MMLQYLTIKDSYYYDYNKCLKYYKKTSRIFQMLYKGFIL